MTEVGQKIDLRKVYKKHKSELGVANRIEEFVDVQKGEIYKYINKFQEVIVKIKPDIWSHYTLTGFELSDTNCDVNKMHKMSNYDYAIRLL